MDFKTHLLAGFVSVVIAVSVSVIILSATDKLGGTYSSNVYKSLNVRAKAYKEDNSLPLRWVYIKGVSNAGERYYLDTTTILHKKYYDDVAKEEKDFLIFNIKTTMPDSDESKATWEYDILNNSLAQRGFTLYNKNGKIVFTSKLYNEDVVRVGSAGEEIILFVWNYHKENGINYGAKARH